MGPRKRDKKDSNINTEQSKDDTILLSDDSTSSTPAGIRTSSRKRKKTQRLVEKDLTPEKITKIVETPRKSRRSKDMSPPPLKHRQNRMPEQVIMVNDKKQIHIFMMRVTQEVLQTKIDFFDPKMRGEWIESSEKAHIKKKRVLYTEEEKEGLSDEAQAFFLSSDNDLEVLKNKAAKYGRDLKAVPIDGDCLLHAIRDQTQINPNWSIPENRQTLGFYLAKLPEQFFMFAEAYCTEQSYESYVRNFFNGHSYGDELIAGVWGHIWNMKITIISPYYDDLKVFHDDDNNPDVVIVHNGRADEDGHYFSTKMHNKKSKKLPIVGSNHSFKISVLSDVNHHYKNAQEHYKEVKCRQCISDYNSAVDDLSELYNNVMEAKEQEQELSDALTSIQTKIQNLKSCITTCDNRLLLAKAKLKILGVSTSELNKPRPVSQGTQSDFKEPEKEKESADIVMIEETEEDKAVRELLRSENITLPTQQQPIDTGVINPFTFSAPQAITLNPQERIVITPQNTALGVVTPQNTSAGVVTQQNVVQSFMTPQNVAPRGVTSHNITPGNVTGQNIVVGGVTGRNVAPRNVAGQNDANVAEIILDGDNTEYTTVFPQDVIGVQPPGAEGTSTSSDQTQLSVPQGFRRTKFEDTLEIIDLKPIQGQKAAKRFFCARCMKLGVETGYTKRNDLTKHLDGCGTPKEKKHKCTYPDCKAAYIRPDNLKQHIATEHTKQFLYHCKKCKKGFTSSPLATAHRKICFPDNPKVDHIEEDKDPKENQKAKEEDKPVNE